MIPAPATGQEPTSGANDRASPVREAWSWSATWPLVMLTLISVFNYLDRSLLGLALPSIKREMAVSDTVLGLVSGLAFVVVYSLVGIPVAWAADRFNRRNIIAAGLAFWSLMTAATGWVASIWQLALTRFLMGAGEATSTAPANSIIADLFTPGRRPLALALYGTAATISYAALFPVAGWIAEHHGWRAMFVAAGVPGLAVTVLFLLTVREPARQAPAPRRGPSSPDSLLRDLHALFANRCFAWLFAGVTFMGANIWATGAWTATFFERVHGLGMAEAAAIIGPSRGLLGAVGILSGGFLVDRLRKDQVRWRVGIPALACLAVGPAETLFLLGDSATAWYLGFALASFFTLIHQGPIYAAVINIVGERRRALAIAVVLLGASLLGNVIGPSGVGILNDLLAPAAGEQAIRYSLLMIAVSPVIAATCFWRAAILYPRYLAARD